MFGISWFHVHWLAEGIEFTIVLGFLWYLMNRCGKGKK